MNSFSSKLEVLDVEEGDAESLEMGLPGSKGGAAAQGGPVHEAGLEAK